MPYRPLRRLLIACVLLAGPLPFCLTSLASAHDYRLGDLQIGHIWTKPAKAGGKAEIYVPILNMGHHDAKLLSASSPAADKAELRGAEDGGEKPVDSIALPAGKPVALAPWREHVLLTGLTKDLKDGESFELTLDFGPAGTQTVDVEIENAPSD